MVNHFDNPAPPRSLLGFQVADRLAALPVEDVERITPMAELAYPPGLPPVLEGVLDLAGAAIPVLRLDRLFRLSVQQHTGLYSVLVILRVAREQRIALLVDRVTGIVAATEDRLRRIGGEDSFNGCAEATLTIGDQTFHILSPARMIVAKEEAALVEFQAMAQHRLEAFSEVPREKAERE